MRADPLDLDKDVSYYLGKILNNSCWDKTGWSLLWAKIPDGIAQMRGALNNKKFSEVLKIDTIYTMAHQRASHGWVSYFELTQPEQRISSNTRAPEVQALYDILFVLLSFIKSIIDSKVTQGSMTHIEVAAACVITNAILSCLMKEVNWREAGTKYRPLLTLLNLQTRTALGQSSEITAKDREQAKKNINSIAEQLKNTPQPLLVESIKNIVDKVVLQPPSVSQSQKHAR